ncbi:MAG: hypothetical protein ABSD03_11590 [Vulcanimicrobiaceae bacterium]|jgi:hypothetical protein
MVHPSTPFPRVAANVLRRTTFETWLDFHAGTPIRYVVGSPGAGKTTATVLWAHHRTIAPAWITLSPHCSLAELQEQLASVVDSASQDVVLDGVDEVSAEARELLARLHLTVPNGVTFTYLGRSRAALDVRESEAYGLVAVTPTGLLQFDEREVELLTETYAVPSTRNDRRNLIRKTSGWAVAVAGSVRTSALTRSPLTGGYARWRRDEAGVVTMIVESAIVRAPLEGGEALRRVLAGRDAPSPAALRCLRDHGLFVELIDGHPRLNRVVADLAGAAPAPMRMGEGDARAPMRIEMFGRFRMVWGNREVRFARRRDRQIVQYLALLPDGKATRDQLLAAFWPGVERRPASQSLRTACCTIRRAIDECVGDGHADTYFRTEGAFVELRGANVVNTAAKFLNCVREARNAESLGDDDVARVCWEAALRVCVRPLLASEPSTPWVEERRRHYHELAKRGREIVGVAETPRLRALG